MRLTRTLRSLLAWSVALGATAVLGPLAVLAGVVAPGRRLALAVARLWGRVCLLGAGVRLQVEGAEHVAGLSRLVVMANHESSLDIPALLVALPPELEIRFLAKESLFRAPILGRAMRAIGFVPVNREDASTAKDMFERAMEQLRQGCSLLVFPEATRTPDGRLLPFQRGGFLIAMRAGAPIVPVGLEGPRIVMPDGSMTVEPAAVVVRFGHTIPTGDYSISNRRQLTLACREAIDVLRGERGHVR